MIKNIFGKLAPSTSVSKQSTEWFRCWKIFRSFRPSTLIYRSSKSLPVASSNGFQMARLWGCRPLMVEYDGMTDRKKGSFSTRTLSWCRRKIALEIRQSCGIHNLYIHSQVKQFEDVMSYLSCADNSQVIFRKLDKKWSENIFRQAGLSFCCAVLSYKHKRIISSCAEPRKNLWKIRDVCALWIRRCNLQ